MSARCSENIDEWVTTVLGLPQNIATEVELREQANVALNLFLEADIDRSERLNFEELKILCDTSGLPMEEEEEEALIKMDTDDSGTLDIEEWVKWWLRRVSTLPNPVKQQEAIARNTFRKFDMDGSGSLDVSELKRLTSALGANFTDEELDEALAEVDTDGSGLIDKEEFIFWWTNRAVANRNSTSLISFKMRKLAAKAAQVFSTDIFSAVWAGDLDLVKAFLLGEPRLSLSVDTSEHGDGWTALHYAAYLGSETMVAELLKSRSEVNRTNDMGFPALFYAAQRGHVEVCRILLEAGADPCVTGVCALPQPLGSDGPPPTCTSTGTGAEAEAMSAEPAAVEVFMCPAEHCVDTPALRDLFQSMSAKCCNPAVPDYDKVSASLSLSAGTMSLELKQPQKAISHLPVSRWDVKLRLDMQMDTELVAAEVYADIVASGLSLSLSVPALQPKQAQVFPALSLDKTFVRKVQFLCALHKLKRLQLLEATPEALRGAWAEFCAVYSTIDAQFRAVLNMADFMYLLIKKCPDKKNTKDLRHGLRASIEQVTIRNAASAEAAETGKTAPGRHAGTKGSAERKASEASVVNVKDPIALMDAGISELFTRRAAAQAAAAALAEQLQKVQKEAEAASRDMEGTAELLVIPNSKDVASKSLQKDSAPAPSSAPAPVSKGWAWAEDNREGYPTIALQVAAVSCWGAGGFSSSVPVAILSNVGGGRKQQLQRE